jgi:hypothetical protein
MSGTRGGSQDVRLPLIATDDVGGMAYQQVKLDLGADGVSDPVVGSLPVSVATGGNLPITIADGANLDAFSRLRVSTPQTLFESSFEYDLQSDWFATSNTGLAAVSWNSNNRSAHLSVATSSNSATSILQTRQYFPYEKGKSQLIKATFVLGTALADVTRRVGYFDAANGVFLEQTGDGLGAVLRSSTTGPVVDTRVEQADWSIDPLDGSGPSGYTLNPALQQILVIDAQFLGAGRVRLAFDLDGEIIPVHEFQNANRNAVAPYMQTFNLPVRYEITSPTATGTLQAICCDVESEGGVGSPNGFRFSAANAADVNTSGTRTHVLSIRPKATYNGVVNRMVILPEQIAAIVGSQSHLVEVLYNATLNGGTWTSASARSGVEVGLGHTITDPGTVIESYFAAASAAARSTTAATVDSQYPIVLDIGGANPRAITVAATTFTGTGTARASVNWKEVR